MNTGRIRVLVADDEAAVRAAVVALIRAEPNLELVGEAANATDAVAIAAAEQPDVAVTLHPAGEDVARQRQRRVERPPAHLAEALSYRRVALGTELAAR